MPLADGVIYVAASAGTGPFVFGAGIVSALTLAQAQAAGEIVDGQQVSYLALDTPGSPIQREWGHGTYSQSGNSITRTTVLGTVNGSTPGSGAPLNFSIPPTVFLTALAEDIVTALVVGATTISAGISGYSLFDNAGILGQEIAGNPPLATSNMDWYVATTGSDSNPGTISQPFATIQFALTIAQQIDWGCKFYPNIHVADGTYNISNQIKFPALRNPAWSPSGDLTGNLIGNSANPSNVLLVDTSAFQIGIFTATGAAYWNATGFLVDTSESAFLANTGSYIECTRMRYQDSSANNGQFCQPFNANPDGIVHAFGTQTYFPPKIFSLGAVAYFGTVEFFSTSFFLPAGGLAGQFAFLQGINGLYNVRGSTSFSNGNLVTGPQFNFVSTTVSSTNARSFFPGVPANNVITGLSLITSDLVYRVDAPVTGGTVVMLPGQGREILNPAGALATLTVDLPPFPTDGTMVAISTTQVITALTLATTDGATIVDAPTTFSAAGQATKFMFQKSSTTWFPTI